MLHQLAQESSSTTPFDLSVYGVAATTIAILLYAIRVLWLEIKDLRHEKDETAAKSLENITSVATTASHHLSESSKAMEAATVMMHTLAGRSLTAEQWYELVSLLREIKNRRS